MKSSILTTKHNLSLIIVSLTQILARFDQLIINFQRLILNLSASIEILDSQPQLISLQLLQRPTGLCLAVQLKSDVQLAHVHLHLQHIALFDLLRTLEHLDVLLVELPAAVPDAHDVVVPILVAVHLLFVDFVFGVVVFDDAEDEAGCAAEFFDFECEFVTHFG